MISVIDYDGGNTKSILNALSRCKINLIPKILYLRYFGGKYWLITILIFNADNFIFFNNCHANLFKLSNCKKT